MKQKRADEVSELQTRLDELTSKLESMDIDIKKFTVNAARVRNSQKINSLYCNF